MDYQKGFSKIAIILVVLVVIGALAGGYFLFLRGEESPLSLPTFTKSSSEDIQGLWMAERVSQADQDWKEQTVPPGTMYIEITKNSVCAGTMTAEEFKCEPQSQFVYTPDGNILNLVLLDQVSGKEIKGRYRWRWEIVNGKLEIISEISMDNKKWGPALKYILEKAQ